MKELHGMGMGNKVSFVFKNLHPCLYVYLYCLSDTNSLSFFKKNKSKYLPALL